MSAPYVIMEFAATSGNRARLKVYHPTTLRPVADVTWEDEPTDQDMKECDRWFAEKEAERLPGKRITVVGVDIPDEDARHALINAELRVRNAGSN